MGRNSHHLWPLPLEKTTLLVQLCFTVQRIYVYLIGHYQDMLVRLNSCINRDACTFAEINEVWVDDLTYHVFHVGGWRKHFPSNFVMVIKNGKHVVLTNITLPPGLRESCSVCFMAEPCAKIGDIGCWRGRGRSRNACCQCTCSTRYAQKY